MLKNPGQELDFTANIATAAASRNPKGALSILLEVTTFYITGQGLYFGKFI